MSQIPNYLRTMTNKYKGDATEKIALNTFTKMNFTCKRYFEAAHDFLHTGKSIDEEIRSEERHLRSFTEELENYRSTVPPKGLEWYTSPPLTWEEYRKSKLKYGKWHVANVRKYISSLREKEHSAEETWGKHFENLKKYTAWLEKQKHYPRFPDFIALKEDKAYVIEVKSEVRGKRAFLGEFQKKALEKAYDFGLTPMFVTIPIDINIEIGEPKIAIITNTRSQ